MRLRVGLIDSGLDESMLEKVAEARAFPPVKHSTGDLPDNRDRIGHGSHVGRIICQGDVEIALFSAQVFFDRLRCSAVQVADALDWLRSQHVRVINLSLGLREDNAALRAACDHALRAGIILCASAPARGPQVYPAAYPGVLRATGDARCRPGEISCLGTGQADFGACVRTGSSTVAGASIGCAGVTRAVLDCLAMRGDMDRIELLAHLRRSARYQGPERRRDQAVTQKPRGQGGNDEIPGR